MRPAVLFTQRDLVRALKAAKAAGVPVTQSGQPGPVYRHLFSCSWDCRSRGSRKDSDRALVPGHETCSEQKLQNRLQNFV